MAVDFLNDWALNGNHRGCPRRIAPADGWRTVGEALRSDGLALLGLWGDFDAVHAALYDARPNGITVVSCPVTDGRVPSLGRIPRPGDQAGARRAGSFWH